MSKPHVAVLMGGISAEHEISMASGGKVAAQLDGHRYKVTPVLVRRDGLWEPAGGAALELHQGLAWLKDHGVDCVFIALHGPYGEDGRVQGMLDLCGIPYTGSGPTASAVALDKILAKAVMRDAEVPTARDVIVQRSDWRENRAAVLAFTESDLGFPCVVKCPLQGSSLGMAIPQSAADLERVLPKLFEIEQVLLFEAYLKGTEVTCSVLDAEKNVGPRALPVTEIVPVSAAFFDYTSKYTPGATEEITPARIDDELTRKIQDHAVRAHAVMGCKGFSRSDFIIVDDEPYWLEINTIPGLTDTSLFPQAAAAVGVSYGELMTLLVEDALARRLKRHPIQA